MFLFLASNGNKMVYISLGYVEIGFGHWLLHGHSTPLIRNQKDTGIATVLFIYLELGLFIGDYLSAWFRHQIIIMQPNLRSPQWL
jgi:hypothetical protein